MPPRLGDSSIDTIQNLPLKSVTQIAIDNGLIPGILETPQQWSAQVAQWNSQFSAGGFLQQNQTAIVMIAAALAGLALLKGLRG